MKDRLKTLTFKKVLFGAILLVTLVTSGWSLATLLIGYGLPWLIAIGAVLVYDGSAVYYGKTAMEYATTEDSGAYERFMTWLMVLMSVGINGYHGWMISPVYGVILGSIPATSGLLHHSSLKQNNLAALRNRGRLAKAMPKFPALHWTLFPRKTFRAFKQIAGSRLEALTERALAEEGNEKVTLHNEKTFLYHLLDNEGKLLYVGITNDTKTREQQHRRSEKQFDRMEVRMEFPNRTEAMEEERRQITQLNPPLNIQMNGGKK